MLRNSIRTPSTGRRLASRVPRAALETNPCLRRLAAVGKVGRTPLRLRRNRSWRNALIIRGLVRAQFSKEPYVERPFHSDGSRSAGLRRPSKLLLTLVLASSACGCAPRKTSRFQNSSAPDPPRFSSSELRSSTRMPSMGRHWGSRGPAPMTRRPRSPREVAGMAGVSPVTAIPEPVAGPASPWVRPARRAMMGRNVRPSSMHLFCRWVPHERTCPPPVWPLARQAKTSHGGHAPEVVGR